MQTDPMMDECIVECHACSQVCLENVRHCLEKGGSHAEPAHISLMLDCSQICQVSADFMTRDSEFHQRTCEVCTDVCEACARSCEDLGDDQELRACAEACRRCASSCRKMVDMKGMA